MGDWEGLNPPYATIVADPPWPYPGGMAPFGPTRAGNSGPNERTSTRRCLPYTAMSVGQVKALRVADLAAPDTHLYLWTTNRYLRDSYDVAEAWGFTPSQVLVWCKPPMGIGPGGAFSITTEFVLFCRRGTLSANERVDSTWWTWPRGRHSEKPGAFLDLVERVSPGPYVELFARAPRLGWDAWGKGYEIGEAS